jgi:glycogen debranching enzyme
VIAVEAIAPDASFLERARDGLERYAAWMDASRDPDGTGMYDVVDQFETGQEYMSRYLAVDPDADRYGWENRIRLKGIDVTTYQYQLRRALARVCRRLGRFAEADAHDARAERVGRAILDTMWDPSLGLFCDVAPGSLARTGVKAAVSFYPLMTDLLDDAHVERLIGHLEDPRSFGTPFPLPSSSVDDAQFDAEALWKGKRHNCPWNGRVWPMTNSHVVHGLIHQWRLGRRFVGPVAGRLLSQYVHLMFHDGDLARPNCFEHYNPFTGQACVYRGIDDYQHS